MAIAIICFLTHQRVGKHIKLFIKGKLLILGSLKKLTLPDVSSRDTP